MIIAKAIRLVFRILFNPLFIFLVNLLVFGLFVYGTFGDDLQPPGESVEVLGLGDGLFAAYMVAGLASLIIGYTKSFRLRLRLPVFFLLSLYSFGLALIDYQGRWALVNRIYLLYFSLSFATAFCGLMPECAQRVLVLFKSLSFKNGRLKFILVTRDEDLEVNLVLFTFHK